MSQPVDSRIPRATTSSSRPAYHRERSQPPTLSTSIPLWTDTKIPTLPSDRTDLSAHQSPAVTNGTPSTVVSSEERGRPLQRQEAWTQAREPPRDLSSSEASSGRVVVIETDQHTIPVSIMAAVNLPEKFSGGSQDMMDAETFVDQIKYATWNARQMFPDFEGRMNPEVAVYKASQLVANTVGLARQFIYSLDRVTRRDFEKLSEALMKHFPVNDVSDSRLAALRDMMSLSQGTSTVVAYVERCRDIKRRLTLLQPDGNYSGDMVSAMIDGLKDTQVKMLARGLLASSKTGGNFEAAADLLEQMIPEGPSQRTTTSHFRDMNNYAIQDPTTRVFAQILSDMSAKSANQLQSTNDSIKLLTESIAKLAISQASQNHGYQAPQAQRFPAQPNAGGTRLDPALNVNNGGTQPPMARQPAMGGAARPNYNKAQCFLCGEYGHISPACTGVPMPQERQNQLRQAATDRRNARESRLLQQQQEQLILDGQQASNFAPQNNPLNVGMGGQMQAANQVEVQTVNNDSLAAFVGSNPQMSWVQDVNMVQVTDNDMSEVCLVEVAGPADVRDVYSAYVDVNALGDKRRASGAELTDRDGGIADIGPSQRTIADSRHPSPQNVNEESQLVKVQKKPRQPKQPRRLVGLQGPIQPDIGGFMNQALIPVSMMQLCQMLPGVKREIAQQLRLQPKPDPPKKKAKQKPKDRITKAPTTRSTARKAAKTAGGDDMDMEVEVEANLMNSIQRFDEHPVSNFYTEATVANISIGLHEYVVSDTRKKLSKVLVDGGAGVNLIPEWVAKSCQLEFIPDKSLKVKGWDGASTSLTYYCRVMIEVAGVRRRMICYVYPGTNTAYTLLLSRSWLISVGAFGDYLHDEYYIRDTPQSEFRQLTKAELTHERSPARSVSFNPEHIPSKVAARLLSHSIQQPTVEVNGIDNMDISQIENAFDLQHAEADEMLESLLEDMTSEEDETESDDDEQGDFADDESLNSSHC